MARIALLRKSTEMTIIAVLRKSGVLGPIPGFPGRLRAVLYARSRLPGVPRAVFYAASRLPGSAQRCLLRRSGEPRRAISDRLGSRQAVSSTP